MSSNQLFPEVLDRSNVGSRFARPFFLTVGIEGAGDDPGTATVRQLYSVSTGGQADELFGGGSTLSALIKWMISRGVSPVVASASVMDGSSPSLSARQAVWSVLESDPDIRIRMTDSTAQATLAALARSAEYAESISNKQIAFGGLAAGTSKADLLTAATAISSKRFVLVGPGILDIGAALQSGNYAAAVAAAEVSKNSDIADDLDLFDLANLTGIEVNNVGQPVFNRRVVAGSVVNDFEDLLQGGVSPIMRTHTGTVAITHLRTTYTADGSFDSLQTRLIADQVFIDVRDYLYNNKFLRKGNSPTTRDLIRAGVQAMLEERSTWISPIVQADGSLGYDVQVTPSNDLRQVTVAYQGQVIRGIQTIVVDAELTVPV